jgi:hypothetical protein
VICIAFSAAMLMFVVRKIMAKSKYLFSHSVLKRAVLQTDSPKDFVFLKMIDDYALKEWLTSKRDECFYYDNFTAILFFRESHICLF